MNHDWYCIRQCSQQQISLLFIIKGDKHLMVLHSTSEKAVHQQHHHAILYLQQSIKTVYNPTPGMATYDNVMRSVCLYIYMTFKTYKLSWHTVYTY